MTIELKTPEALLRGFLRKKKINPMKPTYSLHINNQFTALGLGMMAAAVLIRIVYFAVEGGSVGTLLVHLLLPVLAAVTFFYVVLKHADHAEYTALGVLFGVVFFIIKAFTFDSKLHTILCVILYLTVLTLYGATVFGLIPTKKLLYPLFGLPLLYHIFVEDMQLYVFAEPPVPYFQWLPEISVLLIMAGLLCISLGLEGKRV